MKKLALASAILLAMSSTAFATGSHNQGGINVGVHQTTIVNVNVNTNQTQVNQNTAGLAQEIKDRKAGDAALNTRVTAVESSSATALKTAQNAGAYATKAQSTATAALAASAKNEAYIKEVHGYTYGLAKGQNHLAAENEKRKDEIKNVSNVAQDGYNKAVNAQNTADVAVAIGQDATNRAINAQSKAEDAVAIGQDATNRAINAQSKAEDAVAIGQDASNKAINAQNTADYAVKVGQNNSNEIININNQAQVTETRVSANETKITSTTNRVTKVEARADQTDIDIQQIQTVNQRQDFTLSQHSEQLSNQQAWNQAMDTRLNGYYERLTAAESAARRADRKADRALEGGAIALAVAGHQFSTDRSAGFQTAVAVSTMGGKQALSVAAGGAVSENVFVNGAIGQAGNTTGAVVSGTYRWK